ncbi:MAG: ArsR family transcriptional regulator [Nanoarchaeota archaeon]|nr:ArsR family transcriptional regulator [Nanoarchaeota archaeon]
MKRRNYQKEILYYLKHKRKGVNISEIVRNLKINKLTVSKYLRQMEFLNLVRSRKITETRKLWFYKSDRT